MKKLLSFIFVFIALLTLASCGETPEQKNEKQFKEYLQANDAMTVDEFDALFVQDESVVMPEDLFTNLTVENIRIDVAGAGMPSYYIWQNKNKVYFAPSVTTDTSGPVYIDLAELEAAYDQSRGESTLKPSEMIDAVLEGMNSDPTAQVTLNLETILGALSFKFEDFEMVEVGKYALKNSALCEKIASLSGGVITSAELEAQLASSGYTLNFYTYFNGSIINGFEFNLSMTQGGVSMSMGFKLMLLFNKDQFSGISLEANIPGTMDIKLSIKLENESLLIVADITTYEANEQGIPMPINISASITITKENISLSVLQDKNELLFANINLVLTESTGKYTFGLNGAIRYAMSAENTGSFTITSGSSVSIPTEVKALETSATNLMSQNNNNQGDTNVEVQ